MRYVLDVKRTTELYRAIVMNSRVRMREILRELAKLQGVVSPCESAVYVREDKRIYAAADQVEDVSALFLCLCNDNEALDRDDHWSELGVWIPAA